MTFLSSPSAINLSSSRPFFSPRVLFRSNRSKIACHSTEGSSEWVCGNKGLRSNLPFTVLAVDVSPSANSSSLTATVGSPSQSPLLSQWILGPRHIFLLNIIACSVGISASWLLFSAIPTILAFKRAAKSLERLMDVTTEELPDTMAALRLSGMEISELTTELSDLGQEITQGVRSSTRAVRVAEERLRHLTSMLPTVSTQDRIGPKEEATALAKKARELREGIAKGRLLFGAMLSVSQIFLKFQNLFMSSRPKKL
ncbi:hypothetical protein HPP92_026995 [Vanilla planifolia]|uniref:Transmembrane protein n=1 Tax=Vanilla planifolia TaxID=51239 RepID=A0A835PD80_VANPL|nr:hypothetical protein HPP92_027146 [Vanilla planifolia]KAG0449986.1 hypothetical protein HPP92_026995 [Vanilla planifolia]